MKRRLSLWTDGSAEERSGKPGGWAFIVVEGDAEVASGAGGSASTTCVLMELEAVKQALRWAAVHAADASLEVVSDSSIALDVAMGRFVPKPHAELAQQLATLAKRFDVVTRKVRAHTGLKWNELADERASEAKRAAPVPKKRKPRVR